MTNEDFNNYILHLKEEERRTLQKLDMLKKERQSES